MAEIKYILGDSQKKLLKEEANKYKLILTSPPYNVGKEYESKTSIESYLQEQDKIVKELVSVLHPNGSICWQVDNYVNHEEVFPLDITSFQGKWIEVAEPNSMAFWSRPTFFKAV